MRIPATAVVVTHVPHEGPGAIGSYLLAQGDRVELCPIYLGASIPPPGAADLLVVMGGPMSVCDADRLPWLSREITAVAEHLRAGTPVLGVCLGAQLIAAALGAAVYPGAHREIGWWPCVMAPPSGPDDPWGDVFGTVPAHPQVFHWHGDTFDLPAGAMLRASSAACRNQLFTVGDRTVGIQFHVEMDDAGIRALTQASDSDIGRAAFDSTPVIADRAAFLTREAALNRGFTRRFLFRLLDHLRSTYRRWQTTGNR